ncbi:MAG: Glu-tRNA(Gln) amidotransferase GatDE subunit E, partial [Bacteroidota bacterium]
SKKLDAALAVNILPVVYQYPKMDFDSILETIKFKKVTKEKIQSQIPFLKEKFASIRMSKKKGVDVDWIMGNLRKTALGNLPLAELKKMIEKTK